MGPLRAVITALGTAALVLTAVGCGQSDESPTAASSPAAASSSSSSNSTPRSLQSYLLSKDDFPAGTTFLTREQVIAAAKIDPKPDKEECRIPARAGVVTTDDVDAIAGYLRSLVYLGQVVHRPQYDLALIRKSMQPPCAPVRSPSGSETGGEMIVTEYTVLPTSVPDALVFGARSTFEGSGKLYADVMGGFVNRDGVGVSVTMNSRSGTPGTEPAPIDRAEFDKYFDLAVARADDR